MIEQLKARAMRSCQRIPRVMDRRREGLETRGNGQHPRHRHYGTVDLGCLRCHPPSGARRAGRPRPAGAAPAGLSSFTPAKSRIQIQLLRVAGRRNLHFPGVEAKSTSLPPRPPRDRDRPVAVVASRRQSPPAAANRRHDLIPPT